MTVDQLGSDLRQLHDSLELPARPAGTVAELVEGRVLRRRRQRRVRRTIAVALTVGLIGGAIALVASRDSNAKHLTTIGSGDDDRWRVLPESPLGERGFAATVAVDGSLFVWGGLKIGSNSTFADGAMFNPDHNEWTKIAPSPLPGGVARAVWTGSLVIVTNETKVAAYDPATDAWRALPQASAGESRTAAAAVIDGEVYFLPAAVEWNPTTDAWRPFAAPPVYDDHAELRVWSGKLIASGTVRPIRSGSSSTAMYDPATDEWKQLPAPPFDSTYDPISTTVVGDELMIVTWLNLDAAALDLHTLHWRTLPNFPHLFTKCRPQVQAVGDVLVASVCGTHAALAPQAEHWTGFAAPTDNPINPPAESGVLISVANGVYIDGSFLATSDPQWLDSPNLGPTLVDLLTVTRGEHPDTITATRGETVTVDIADTGCDVSTIHGSDVPLDAQRSLADAALTAESGPANIEFANERGAYTLACPNAQAYAASIARFTVHGEVASPTDATKQFATRTFATSADMAEGLRSELRRLHPNSTVDAGPQLSDNGTPLRFETFVYDRRPSGTVVGHTYTFKIEQRAGQWSLVSATDWAMCAVGVTAGKPNTCR